MIIAILLIFTLCCALLMSAAWRMGELEERIELLETALTELRPELEQEKRWSKALNNILNYSQKIAMGGGESDE